MPDIDLVIVGLILYSLYCNPVYIAVGITNVILFVIWILFCTCVHSSYWMLFFKAVVNAVVDGNIVL